MTSTYPRSRLLIFAKAPLPGWAKTRLIPLLGRAGAARLQAALLRSTVTMACEAALAPVELWIAGQGDEAELARLAYGQEVPVHYQDGLDLGERMYRATLATPRPGPLVIIGTDCLEMDRGVLQQAFAALARTDMVLQPAEDGGYTLIGLRRTDAAVFRGIDWGSDRVLEQSVEKASSLGWSVAFLPMSWDLDRPEDYQRALDESLLPVRTGEE